jgi:type IVB pilus formation R64 PilN family outer membrane protein
VAINLQANETLKGTGAVVRVPGAKLAGEEVRLDERFALPDWFLEPFDYITAGQTLQEVVLNLNRRLDVPVVVDLVLGETSSEFPVLSDRVVSVDWKGDLKGFLDYLTAQLGIYWRYMGGAIRLFAMETRSFMVNLPIGSRSVNASITLDNSASQGTTGSSGGGGASSSSSSGTVSVSTSLQVDIYNSIVEAVTSIIMGGAKPAGGGQTVIANPGLGVITVTAPPPALDRVSHYIDSINKRFSKNVLVSVKIYEFNTTRSHDAGISADMIFEDLSKRYGMRLLGVPSLNGQDVTSFVLERLEGSKLSGSKILLQELSKYGDVSLVTSGQVVAANGQPSPLQVANEITYLASASTTQTADVGSTTTLEPGVRKVGFTANFLPLILADNRILLQYQINLSSLISLDEISSGDTLIQTPQVASQSLQQQAYVRDGQSIVLFGFEQTSATREKQRGLVNFTRKAGGERRATVIVLEVHCLS